jgi:hypothetical protein
MVFLNTPDDLEWLRVVHLNLPQVPPFYSAMLHGNEDCPAKIELFEHPDPVVTDMPIAVYELQEDQSYVMV